jgi:uncharacterized protein (TIGR03437 family)
VDNTPADGGIPSVLTNTLTKPIVMLGGITVPQADVLFSGLTPQFVGVNQLNIIIPPTAPAGNAVPLQIQMGGVTSPSNVTIAVSQ